MILDDALECYKKSMKLKEMPEETLWSAVIEATRTNSSEPIKKAMQAYADQQVKAERDKVIDECIKILDDNPGDMDLVPLLRKLKS